MQKDAGGDLISTIIGLKSGKEFIVDETFYPFTHKVTGAVTTIFISSDRKRMITVPPPDSPIEFFDESADEKLLTSLKESTKEPVVEAEAVYHDPNIL